MRLILAGMGLALAALAAAFLILELHPLRPSFDFARTVDLSVGAVGVPVGLAVAVFVLLVRRSPVVVTPSGLQWTKLYVLFPPRRLLFLPYLEMKDIRLVEGQGAGYIEKVMADGRAFRLWHNRPEGMLEVLRRLRAEAPDVLGVAAQR